jgi:ATP-binding cassette subfamily B protein
MAAFRASLKRKALAPEVVQTSAMDCGPASLKCLLEGFGIPVSYGRLREACQTDVDGTSIDTLEEVAAQLGLQAEQIMVPLDHLFLTESNALPAIAVVLSANRMTHFVVIWRRHGSIIQVMDPAAGRRWRSRADLLDEVYVHSIAVPAAGWREWAGSDDFLNPLRRRLKELRVSGGDIESLVKEACCDEGWRGIAALDAATRMTASLVRSRGIRGGRQAAVLIRSCFSESLAETGEEPQAVPSNYWIARPAAPDEEGQEQLTMRGAVLVAVRGRRSSVTAGQAEGAPPLSPELVAALEERPAHPARDLLALLKADGVLTPMMLTLALAAAACGVMIEALLFQGLFDLSRKLGVTEQRIGAMALLLTFALGMLLLELPIAAGLIRLGRKLEARLRVAFLEKIPRLGDRYFQSRLISDMAERSHSLQSLRILPTLGGQFIRYLFEIALTTAGIIWIDPAGAPVALTVAFIAVALPLAMQTRLKERDLRIRSHLGALGRFYLDALLGLVPIRTHRAERAVRREHESLLVEWTYASNGMLKAAVTVEAIQATAGFALAAWLLLDHLARGGGAGGVLLLVYWALNLPALGQEIALIAQQYPQQRNVTLRLLEPLGAPEDIEGASEATLAREDEIVAHRQHSGEPALAKAAISAGKDALREITRSASDRAVIEVEGQSEQGRLAGVTLGFESVSVRAAGHLILDEIDLEIEAGSQVAIVGPSGAGKSSFVGLLLGWHRAASGRVLIDGEQLAGDRLDKLRRQTAWVDPGVQLWNRSLVENLRYGSTDHKGLPLATALDAADLRDLLEKLPDGLQTAIGEGGGLLSGGEGQRVRLGRAMLRAGVRLVILDEPFRGLDRRKRRDLLKRARAIWSGATMLCITHDVGETRDFERVLVIEQGRVTEDGPPLDLYGRNRSRYRDLIEAEDGVREKMWTGLNWRHLWIDRGMLYENDRGEDA